MKYISMVLHKNSKYFLEKIISNLKSLKKLEFIVINFHQISFAQILDRQIVGLFLLYRDNFLQLDKDKE